MKHSAQSPAPPLSFFFSAMFQARLVLVMPDGPLGFGRAFGELLVGTSYGISVMCSHLAEHLMKNGNIREE